jgi:hypothetical protein
MAVVNVLSGPQDALLKASRTMDERCITYSEVVGTNPRFKQLSVNFGGLIVRIDAAIMAKQSSRHTTNVTSEKNNRISTFVGDLDSLAMVVVDMAAEEKKSDWATMANRALKTKTKGLSEEGLMAVSVEFIALVKTIEPKLLDHYAIDTEEIAAMEQEIADIKALRLKKEVTVDQKSLDNTTLANLFKALKEQKTKMVRLSERFAKKSPEFYAAFQKASEETLKLGVKTAKTEKEKTPEELAVDVAKKGVVIAKKEAAAARKEAASAKKAEVAAQKVVEKQNRAAAKAQKSKTTAKKQAVASGIGSAANGNNQAAAADASILEVGKA